MRNESEPIDERRGFSEKCVNPLQGPNIMNSERKGRLLIERPDQVHPRNASESAEELDKYSSSLESSFLNRMSAQSVEDSGVVGQQLV
mmetsp:Transcript_31947/g.39659  ORF Transcript_31947/g.39659 Transcript_31947/m.39659 type:complete len:88 (+) Transcript_31947:281-544(+)